MPPDWSSSNILVCGGGSTKQKSCTSTDWGRVGVAAVVMEMEQVEERGWGQWVLISSVPGCRTHREDIYFWLVVATTSAVVHVFGETLLIFVFVEAGVLLSVGGVRYERVDVSSFTLVYGVFGARCVCLVSCVE